MIVDRLRLAALLPGYELGGQLGSGAFGLVLAGRHRSLDRQVAIKVLPAAQHGCAGFAVEARLLALMDHPHIVRVYDHAEDDDLCVIVMELLAGGTLTHRRKGVSAEGACAVGLAVATALDHAHDKGVLHRDIKSDNMLFDATGLLKVTDFGIAKVLEGAAATASAIVGTPTHMAPEQITGGRLGPATDLYALGVLLYQLLTGALPFDPTTPERTRWHHLHTLPAPLHGVPVSIGEVVLRALAKDPAARQPSAHAFSMDLADAAGRVYGPRWTSRSGIMLRLDDDVREAVDASPGHTLTSRPVSPLAGPHPGPPSPAADTVGSGEPPTHRAGSPGAEGEHREELAARTVAKQPRNDDHSPPEPADPAVNVGAAPSDSGPSSDGAAPDPWLPVGTDPAGSEGPAHHLVSWTGWLSPRRWSALAGARHRWAFAVAATTVAAGIALVLVVVLLPGERSGPPSSRPSTSPTGVPMDRLGPAVPSFRGVVVGGDGSIYTSDYVTDRVWKIDPAGVVSAIAGTGTAGFSGDGGPARQAPLDIPEGLAVGDDGSIYIADSANSRVRKIDPAGTISTITSSILAPTAVAVDHDGALYVASTAEQAILKIDPAGVVSAIAGTGTAGFSGDGGPARQAQLSNPRGVAVGDDGSIYIADSANSRVRKIDPAGTISTIAGGDGGPARQAQLSNPWGVAVGGDGSIYIADYFGYRVWKIDPAGVVSAIAGTGTAGFSGDGGPARQAQLSNPWGVAVGGDGSIYIADDGNGIRKIDPAGTISTIVF